MPRMRVTHVTSFIENGVVVVAFADHDFSPRCYLTLQRSINDTIYDQELGVAGAYIDVDFGGGVRSGYVQFARAAWMPSQLNLVLSSKSANDLDLESQIVVDIAVNLDAPAAIGDHLALALAPCELETGEAKQGYVW